MTSLRRYYLLFLICCIALTLLVGVIAALLPANIATALTAIPYLITINIVLFRFIKNEKRAPTQIERKKMTLSFLLIFWAYNIGGVLLSLCFFAYSDPEIMKSFLIYIQNMQFISLIVIIILVVSIPLYLVTYWLYGKHAQRMAERMLNMS